MNKTTQQIDISKRVLDMIDDKKVKPKSRLYFILQESGVWTLGIVATFCGAVAISTTLFILTTAPIKLNPITHDSVVRFWIDFIPLLWFILFISFILITDFFLRKTKKGYRYSFVVLSVSSVTLSVILGYLGFLIGLGEIIDKSAGLRIPFYQSNEMMIHKIWSQPSKGLLMGKIINNKTTLETEEGILFDLDMSQLSDMQKNLITEGSYVSMIGTTTHKNIFLVCVVIPSEDDEVAFGLLQFERKSPEGRINTCKGVRPYDRLKNKILNYENQ